MKYHQINAVCKFQMLNAYQNVFRQKFTKIETIIQIFKPCNDDLMRYLTETNLPTPKTSPTFKHDNVQTNPHPHVHLPRPSRLTSPLVVLQVHPPPHQRPRLAAEEHRRPGEVRGPVRAPPLLPVVPALAEDEGAPAALLPAAPRESHPDMRQEREQSADDRAEQSSAVQEDDVRGVQGAEADQGGGGGEGEGGGGEEGVRG